ncbi:MAG: hypothetical protein KGL39_31275 [Patescibacteria group bacterium]|nr:hypothetical protein [Patescibacteria group bacterium]
MATASPAINNTVLPLSGGVNSYGGQGEEQTLSFNGIFSLGDEVTVDLTDNLSGIAYQFGAGNVTNVNFNFVSTFNNKVYGLAGATAYFSALSLPSTFNDPNAAGNGFVTMGNYFSTPEDLAAIAPYQGSLLFCFRRLVQIWGVDPDPANYALRQMLPNIGTVAPLSVQPVGDMDVYMLADSGVRSVRVRDASNNAIIADIGTPIDAILQPVLATLTDAQKATACGIVDPTSNRYWLFIPNTADADNGVGKIYVFSYFPSSQIAAWSTYSPSYQASVAAPGSAYVASQLTYTGLLAGRYAWTPGANEVSLTVGGVALKSVGSFVVTPAMVTAGTNTAVVVGTGATVSFTGVLTLTTYFTPTKFLVYNGQIFVRDSANNFYSYGGTDTNTYENCGVNWTMPFMDSGTPATVKQFQAIDVGFSGSWAVGVCTDYNAQIFKPVYVNTTSSFIRKAQPYIAAATHYSIQGIESGNGYALFSSAAMHLKVANEKV